MTDLKRFEYVLALAKSLNFSRAAASLHISQSTLSQYIQKLEEEIGRPLFDRTSATLRLTPYGELYVQGARRIMDVYAETLDSIADADCGTAGVLRVGIGPSRAPYILPSAVRKLKDQYPGVRFEFHELKSNKILEKLNSGEIDLAYTIEPTDVSGYEVFPVEQEEITLVAAKHSHLLDGYCYNGEVDFADLATVGFIVLGDSQMLTIIFDRLCAECRMTPEWVMSVSEISTALSLVKSNLGVMLLPSGYYRYGDLANELDFYRLRGKPQYSTVAVFYKKGKYLGKAARRFIEILREVAVHK